MLLKQGYEVLLATDGQMHSKFEREKVKSMPSCSTSVFLKLGGRDVLVNMKEKPGC
jgi:hypothetical protein